MYMLFAGSNYYPAGGMYDFVKFVSSTELTDEDRQELSDKYNDWYHIATPNSIVTSGRLK